MKLFGGLAVVTLLAAGVFWSWPSSKQAPAAPNQLSQASIQGVNTEIPAVTQAAAQTSSDNYHYDAAKKTASYTDSLDTSTLFISQQQHASAVNEATLKKIAAGNGGGTEIDTAKGKAFIINTPGVAQQVVLFGSGSYLIVINSNSVASQNAWISYINSFKTKAAA